MIWKAARSSKSRTRPVPFVRDSDERTPTRLCLTFRSVYRERARREAETIFALEYFDEAGDFLGMDGTATSDVFVLELQLVEKHLCATTAMVLLLQNKRVE